MAKALTLRLDERDFEALRTRAETVGVKPGTMARMLLRTGLTSTESEPSEAKSRSIEALEWFANFKPAKQGKGFDAAEVVRRGRAERDSQLQSVIKS